MELLTKADFDQALADKLKPLMDKLDLFERILTKQPEYYTLQEFCEKTRQSESTVRTLLRSGALVHKKNGERGHYKIHHSEVSKFLNPQMQINEMG
jgi:excisionase family DNA binding protein